MSKLVTILAAMLITLIASAANAEEAAVTEEGAAVEPALIAEPDAAEPISAEDRVGEAPVAEYALGKPHPDAVATRDGESG